MNELQSTTGIERAAAASAKRTGSPRAKGRSPTAAAKPTGKPDFLSLISAQLDGMSGFGNGFSATSHGDPWDMSLVSALGEPLGDADSGGGASASRNGGELGNGSSPAEDYGSALQQLLDARTPDKSEPFDGGMGDLSASLRNLRVQTSPSPSLSALSPAAATWTPTDTGSVRHGFRRRRGFRRRGCCWRR